jgi:GDPmannose 4,6-dehydratase
VANYRESYSLHASTGVLFNHESPLRPKRFVTQKIIDSAKKIASGEMDKLVLGRLDIQRDWGWAPEYIDAMWRMLQLETPEDLVIATGQTHSLEEFVAEAFAINDLNWEKYVEISEEFYRPTDILYSGGNPAKAQQLLNWSAKTKMADVLRLMSE